jgi:hypothetical protein
MTDARTLANALNGEVVGRDQVLCPGPGHSPHDRSLSVRLTGGDDFVVHSFAGDDWITCKEHVHRTLGITRSKPVRATALRRPRSTATTTAMALKLWQRSTDAHGTTIESYLSSRHLELPAGDAVIRHCPRIGPHGESDAIMIALMRDVLTDRPVAAHRTFVDHTARKLGRKMIGPCRGAAIKLEPATDTLVAAEGLETALAAIAAGMTPVWAMGSAGAIGTLPALPMVATLVILAEIDGGASRDAIASCTHRWCENANKKVFVVTPTVGEDFGATWTKLGGDWRSGVDIKQARP